MKAREYNKINKKWRSNIEMKDGFNANMVKKLVQTLTL